MTRLPPADSKAAARLRVSPGALYTQLNSELRRQRVTDCTCRMPLPYVIDRPDEVSANWRIGTPSPCAHKCDILIVEIVAAMWAKYDLIET